MRELKTEIRAYKTNSEAMRTRCAPTDPDVEEFVVIPWECPDYTIPHVDTLSKAEMIAKNYRYMFAQGIQAAQEHMREAIGFLEGLDHATNR